MKQVNAKQFNNEWAYEQERKQEKKQYLQFRKLRQNKRSMWTQAVD